MEECIIFTMQIHLSIFQASTTGRFSYLPLDYYLSTYSCLPLDYYLSTCCGGPSFVLAFLCDRYLLRLYYNLCWMQPGPWVKWVFHTSPITFGLYSKPKVKSQSWLSKYHVGEEKKAPTVTILKKKIKNKIKSYSRLCHSHSTHPKKKKWNSWPRDRTHQMGLKSCLPFMLHNMAHVGHWHVASIISIRLAFFF